MLLFSSSLCEDDEGAATVGIGQFTKEPTAYDHPAFPNARFWELPGIGTPSYPDMETYTKKVELEKYDAFLIFTATRFSENSLQLADKIKSMKRKLIYIRTKIDECVRAEARRRSFDEQGILTKIRCECLKCLGDQLSCEEDVFLISSHDPNKWEFSRLTEAIFDAVVMLQEKESSPRPSHNILQRLKYLVLKVTMS